MRTGATISAAAHIGFLAAAILGLGEADTERSIAVATTNVSVLSLDAYNAAISEAPSVEDVEPSELGDLQIDTSQIDSPSADTDVEAVPEVEAPDAPEPGAVPDLSTFASVDPDVATDLVQPEPAPVGSDTPLLAGPTFDGSLNSNETALLAPAAPSVAPRIDTRAAPKPPERATEALASQAETKPEEQAETETVTEAAAPKEATTEISPAEEEDEVATPTAAMRPPGRPPVNSTTASDQSDSEPRPTGEETQSAEEVAIASALEEVATGRGTRLGGDFSSSQKSAIGNAIDPFWNRNILTGKAQYEQLVVTVRVRLNADGTMLGAVEAINPSNPTGDFLVAFSAARRAVIRATQAGLPLPRDKFKDGDYLEIRFDPGRGAVTFE